MTLKVHDVHNVLYHMLTNQLTVSRISVQSMCFFHKQISAESNTILKGIPPWRDLVETNGQTDSKHDDEFTHLFVMLLIHD